MKINLNDSNENNNVKTEETHKKFRKLRPLVKKEPIEIKIQQKPKKTIYVLSILVLVSSIVLYYMTNSCEFKAEFEKSWNKLLYGDESYCIRKINTDEILVELRNQVVGQNDAIELIRGSLEKANREGYVRIAINGAVGTGKSLSAEIISKQFRWQSNIQKIVWDGNSTDVKVKILSHLSKCGYNLLIIDNLDFNETTIEFVKDVGEMIHAKSKGDFYRIVFLVIFNESLENDDSNPLQEILKDFVKIDYYQFTLDDFIKCIEVHKKLYNIEITPDDFDELKELDFRNSGCKLVSKRLDLVK